MTILPCSIIRGGSSRGAYFLSADLPADPGQSPLRQKVGTIGYEHDSGHLTHHFIDIDGIPIQNLCASLT